MKTGKHDRLSRKRGYTLIEMMIATTIGLITVAMFSSLSVGSLQNFYSMVEKSFFSIERRTVAKIVDQDLSYNKEIALAAGSSQSFTVENSSEVIVYDLVADTDYFNLQRTVYDPSDLVNPISTTTVIQKMVGTNGLSPAFSYLDEDATVLSLGNDGTLAAAQLEATERIELAMNRSYILSSEKSSSRKVFSFHIYKPIQYE